MGQYYYSISIQYVRGHLVFRVAMVQSAWVRNSECDIFKSLSSDLYQYQKQVGASRIDTNDVLTQDGPRVLSSDFNTSRQRKIP